MMHTRDERGTVLLRVEDAAQRLDVSRGMIYKIMNSGDLPYVRIGADRRVSEAEIERYIARNTVGVVSDNKSAAPKKARTAKRK